MINRLPSHVIDNQSPLGMLFHFILSVSIQVVCPQKFLVVFLMFISKQHRTKLDPRALKCVFIGYSSRQNGYKCYHPPNRIIFVIVDVTFSETNSVQFPHFRGRLSGKMRTWIWLFLMTLYLVKHRYSSLQAHFLMTFYLVKHQYSTYSHIRTSKF